MEVKKKVAVLDFQSFLEVITNRVTSKDNKHNMKKAFGMLDEEKTGFISI